MARHGSRTGARRHPLAVTSLVSGLAHRGASTLLIFIVALVACAAASTGPAYYASAQTSIVRDTFANALPIERGFEVAVQGEVDHALTSLSDTVARVVQTTVPDAAVRNRLFAAPIEAIEASVYDPKVPASVPLAWRTDICAHLKLRSGRCATAPDEVVVSASALPMTGWKLGQRLRFSGWPTLTVVGSYDVPNFNTAYWFGRGSRYFPNENQSGAGINAPASPDAMFTVRSTVDDATGQPQGSLVIDQLVDNSAVQGSDLGRLVDVVNALPSDPSLAQEQAAITSQLPGVVDTVHSSWRSLAVPVFLITIQLLVLVWLLMFLVVRDAIDARGPEIALMKLRGRRRLRLLGFALGEPVALLAIALPLGVLVGGLACAGLNGALLRPGTPTTVPWLAWAAAAVATFGGLLATLVAGRRTLRRGVVDQWQHASREATRRGWVVDAIVVTAAAGGLAELIVGGNVTSVRHGSLGLLVPGLLGLAVAVLASRLLPAACRALFGTTRRRGGLGAFLAVRHVARRTTGMRTTVILATAFALATFSVASWATGRSNRQLVAQVGVGAPTVLSVVPPQGTDLGKLVDKLDPGGTNAAVVDSSFTDTAGNETLLAVDPQRFAHVAAWRGGFADRSLATLMNGIAPKAAPQVVITGDELRVRLRVQHLKPAGVLVGGALTVPNADGALTLQLGSLNQADGAVALTTSLPTTCPCTLDNLSLSTATTGGTAGFPVSGSVVLDGVDVHDSSGWHPLPGLLQTGQWRAVGGDGQPVPDALTAADAGLGWSFAFQSTQVMTLQVADHPFQLPAVIDTKTAGSNGLNPIQLPGLDTNALTVKPIAITKAVPGTSSSGGLIVDRTYAERAAAGVLSGLVTQQVWIADGAQGAITAGLRKAGVHIVQTQSAAEQADLYARQGPGLASTVFLADAIAAAVLAAAGAVMGLVSAGRRRRFEYAALRAAGASPRSLYAGLLLEQLAVLLFGAVAGAAAGIAAALVAVRSVPEFVTQPTAPPLSYALSGSILAIALVLAFVVLLVVAAVSSRVLLAGARADQLREAPP